MHERFMKFRLSLVYIGLQTFHSYCKVTSCNTARRAFEEGGVFIVLLWNLKDDPIYRHWRGAGDLRLPGSPQGIHTHTVHIYAIANTELESEERTNVGDNMYSRYQMKLFKRIKLALTLQKIM
jgi:hypothetical protein